MEILQHGQKPDDRVQFRCHDCGCVYIANEDEYTIQAHNNDLYYVSFCPECVSRNTVDKTMGDIKSGRYGSLMSDVKTAPILVEKDG